LRAVAEALGPPSTAARDVAFALERFECTADGRLEVVGRWSGVRGRRFIRPSLSLGRDGGQRRLLAELEHKPWAADDDELWRAAFRVDREVAEKVGVAELSVAPDITVELPAPRAQNAPKGRRRARDGGPASRPRPQPAQTIPAHPPTLGRARDREEPDISGLVAERDAAIAARAEAIAECARLRAGLTDAQSALERAEAALAAALAQRETAAAERRGALAARDAVVEARDAAAAERDAALAAVSAAHLARREALTARDAALAERDRAIAARDTALRERDSAIGQRDAAAFERDAALSELNAAIGQPAPYPGRELDPPRRLPAGVDVAAAVRKPEPGYTLPPLLTSSDLPAVRRNVGWVRRVAVIAVLVIVALVLWLMIKPI
jgi:hypothetical protein